MDHLMKVQAFIPCSRSLQEVRIEVGDTVIVAAFKFLVSGKAYRRQWRNGNAINNYKLCCLDLRSAEI